MVLYRKTRVGYWRKIRGITQRELAKMLGVSQKTVSYWEVDLSIPTREQAEIIAKVLRVSVRDLFPYEIL